MNSPITREHTFLCEEGPETVTATEAVPGLLVYEVPDSVSIGNPNRWSLGTRDGFCIAAFPDKQSALRGAADLAPLADWTAPSDALRSLFLGHGETGLRARRLMCEAVTRHEGRFGTRPA
ncbi:hypothetical protein ACH4LN_18095 [Streptomyces albus]|uniref:hypothetical protein n=1 Tax=Streptomyces albus TaxID=1888 RepID=UPI0037B3C281